MYRVISLAVSTVKCWNPSFSHHSPIVILPPLRTFLLGFDNTKINSHSGIESLMAVYFCVSPTLKNPLHSISIALSSCTKSGRYFLCTVYGRSYGSNLYCPSSFSDKSFSSPDLKALFIWHDLLYLGFLYYVY